MYFYSAFFLFSLAIWLAAPGVAVIGVFFGWKVGLGVFCFGLAFLMPWIFHAQRWFLQFLSAKPVEMGTAEGRALRSIARQVWKSERQASRILFYEVSTPRVWSDVVLFGQGRPIVIVSRGALLRWTEQEVKINLLQLKKLTEGKNVALTRYRSICLFIWLSIERNSDRRLSFQNWIWRFLFFPFLNTARRVGLDTPIFHHVS